MLDTQSRLRTARTPLRFQDPRGFIAFGMLVPTVLRIGWYEPLVHPTALWVIQLVLLAVYAVLLALDYQRVRLLSPPQRGDVLAILRPELIALVLSILLCWSWLGLAIMTAPLALIAAVRAFLRLTQTRIPSGLIFIGSFAVLAMVGAGLLMLPAAAPRSAPVSPVDAIFTATSAISQTGLVVRPTGVVLDEAGTPVAGFTRFGQIVILVWIQIGALGVIVFGALFANLVGGSFGLRATQTLGEGTEQGWEGQLSAQRLVTFVILATHLIELIGAVFIYFSWPNQWAGMPADFDSQWDRIYHSIFLSVSGFCNAGFSTTADSMGSLRTHVIPHGILFSLIVFGSIGYAVLENAWRVLVARVRGRRTEQGALIRLSLHAKLILVATFAAYAVGYVAIVLSEAIQTEAPWHLILLDAHFMSINRTTGFNTIDVNDMGGLARLFLMALMFAGGAPGSVAAGVKLIVVSVLVLTVWGTIRGRSETTAFGRTIPDEIVRKCAALAVAFLALVLLCAAGLVLSEEGETLEVLLFEATSATTNTGLTMGVTDRLSTAGRINLTIVMFLGRVGILATLATLATVGLKRRPLIHYPEERVTIF